MRAKSFICGITPRLSSEVFISLNAYKLQNKSQQKHLDIIFFSFNHELDPASSADRSRACDSSDSTAAAALHVIPKGLVSMLSNVSHACDAHGSANIQSVNKQST